MDFLSRTDVTCHLTYTEMEVDLPAEPFDLSNLADLEQQQVCSLRLRL